MAELTNTRDNFSTCKQTNKKNAGGYADFQ